MRASYLTKTQQGENMPIITKAGSPVKGSPTQFTLDKSALAAVSSVAADAYYSDSTNWKEVSLIYRSSTGNQSEVVKFDASLASPTANFAVSLKARNVFEIHKIIIKDFDGGVFEVPRSQLTTAEFDVSFSGGGGGAGPTAYQYYKLRITSAFSQAGNLNSNQYTYAVLNEVKFKVNGINTTPVSAQAYGSWSGSADLLIDGNLGTEIYQSGLNSLVDNIVFNMGSSVSASDILICPRANIGSASDNYVPRNISVLGSNDNSNFTLIKEVEISNNPGDWSANTFRTISLT